MQSRRRVAVIGSGLGGLSAAASLAAKGYEVEIFEKNERIGGKLNLLEKEGFSFDLGPSIIILPQLFARVFERAGKRMEDYVEFVEVFPQWRNFFEDGTRFDIHPDFQVMERELARIGVGEGDAFWSFMQYSKRLYDFSDEVYFGKGAESMRDLFRSGHGPVSLGRRSDFFATMDEGVGRLVKNPHLRTVLDFFVKYVGSSAFDAPAILNLMPYSQLAFGLWYVKGGMYNLARGLGRLLEELGVTINLNSEVVEISRGAGRVEGVILKDGLARPADIVVSNMEVIPCHERLLGAQDKDMRHLSAFAPACSGLVLHLGVDKVYDELAHHNFFYSKDPKGHFDQIHKEKRLPDDPTIYLVAPTRSDPGLAPAGHDIIKILPHIPHLVEPRFGPEDYQALEERVLAKLERMGLSDLRSHIVVSDRLVPDDLERMYYSNKGSIYGVVSDRKTNRGFKAPRRSRDYKNLYFVGGSVNPGGGTPMVTLCGQLVADMIEDDRA